jgi:hypothetical protein
VDLPLTDGRVVQVDLRILTPLETIEVLGAAYGEAKGKGVTEPEDGQPIYDLALMVQTLVRACVDPDSPPEAPALFFDGGVEGILASPLLGTDTIAFLFELYEQHADTMAISPKELDEGTLRNLIESSAGGDLLPFSKLRPGMQWTFVRSMASLLRSFLKDRSGSSSASEPSTNVTVIMPSESAAPMPPSGEGSEPTA